MKTLLAPILFAGAAILPNFAAAQITVPRYIDVLTNIVGNPGFENVPLSTYWDTSATYVYNTTYGFNYAALGFQTSQIKHSGSLAYDLGIYGAEYGNYIRSVVRQNLNSPTLGSAIWNGTVWVYSPGQTLQATFRYTDGSSNTANNYFQNGWSQWDFRSAIIANRTLSSIEFWTYVTPQTPNKIIIDDVSVTKMVRYFL